MAVFLCSGGLDSTVALAMGLSEGKLRPPHIALAFNYGQRNAVELRYARRIVRKVAARFKRRVEFKVVDLRGVFGDGMCLSPLLSSRRFPKFCTGLREVYVPGRNLVFLSVATVYAASHGHQDVVAGFGAQDRASPDCLPEFQRSAARAIQDSVRGVSKVTLRCPLRTIRKADMFRWLKRQGLLEAIVTDTLTCSFGGTDQNFWGRGCGFCGACVSRIKAYAEGGL